MTFENEFLIRLAKVLISQMGPFLEIRCYKIESGKAVQTQIIAKNNQVYSPPAAEEMPKHMKDLFAEGELPGDIIGQTIRTDDGRLIKYSLLSACDPDGTGRILEICYDMSVLAALDGVLSNMISENCPPAVTDDPPVHISAMLENMIEESIRLTGKPVSLMTKEDKMNAIRYLYERGAMLITKAGPRICECFKISKFTLYSYLDDFKEHV